MIFGASPLASVGIAGGRFVIVIPTIAPVLVSKPAADVTRGEWLPSAGAALYAMLSEAAPDTSYIQATTPSTCEIALGFMAAPGNRFRYKAASSMGSGLVFELLSGGVLVARWEHVLSATSDTYSHNLTPEQVAMMTGGYLTARMTATA